MSNFACTDSLLGHKEGDAFTWVKNFYLNFNSGDVILPADLWLDCRDWRSLVLHIEFRGTGGSSLTVTLETAVAASTNPFSWKTVTNCSSAMSSSPVILPGNYNVDQPLMGVARLKFSASGAVSGAVRVAGSWKVAT